MNEIWITTAVGVGGAVAGGLCTKGVDAWLKLRKAGLEERQYEDSRAVEGYQATIDELKSRISHLESLLELQEKRYKQEIDELRKEHIECVRLQTALSVKNDHLSADVSRLDNEIKSLREWRHAMGNSAQVKVLESIEPKERGEP